jgi:hypothetical protein
VFMRERPWSCAERMHVDGRDEPTAKRDARTGARRGEIRNEIPPKRR